MSMADYAEAEVVKYLFTAEVMGTRPTGWFLALHTADPTDTGGSNEVFAAWYARQTCALTRSGNSVTNTALITFPAVTGTAVTITHVSIKDAVNGGNTLAVLPVTSTIYAVGDVPAIQASVLAFLQD